MGNNGLRSLSKSQEWCLIVEELVLFLFGAPEKFTIPRNTLQNVQSKFSNISSDSSVNLGFEFIIQVPFVSSDKNNFGSAAFQIIEKIDKKISIF